MTYPSKTLLKNLSPVSRTISEAQRDAQYAMSIQTFKAEGKLTLNFICEAVIGAVITLAIASPFLIGFYVWSMQ